MMSDSIVFVALPIYQKLFNYIYYIIDEDIKQVKVAPLRRIAIYMYAYK